MATWGASSSIRASPLLVRGEGVYVWDVDGNKYIDWSSQAICVNLGHTVPEQVRKAAQEQLESLPFVYSGLGLTKPRIRLASLMAEIMPGDLTGFLFPTSGAEANECAIRMARRFTGKTKIITHYQSYHGGTLGPLQATGDFRRNFAEGRGADGPVGFIKTMNPRTSSPFFDFGSTDEERTTKALAFLEEQIWCEGPDTIAAIMLESVIGSGGVYPHPKGYMEGVRALCDKYDILLISDEVMVGFGRTGTMWGFQNYDIHPDIVTSAKGLSGAYASVAVVAMRQKLKDYFEVNPIGWGSTFQAHPVSLAIAYECVKYMLENDIVGHVRDTVAPIMKSECERIRDRFASVSEARAIGAFGCLELIDPRNGQPIQDFSGKNVMHPEAIATLKSEFKKNGLFGIVRCPKVHCAPPLIISADETKDAFQRLEHAIEAYDKCFN